MNRIMNIIAIIGLACFILIGCLYSAQAEAGYHTAPEDTPVESVLNH